MLIKGYYGEGLYFREEQQMLTTKTEEQIRTLLAKNHGVGIIGGYYSEGLPICMVSELLIEMLGYSSADEFESKTGKFFTNMISPKSGAAFSEEDFPSHKEPFILNMFTKNGEGLWVRMIKSDFFDASNRLMWIASVSNIAAIYKREQQLIAEKNNAELANRTKTAFLSRMSHDMRTPMNGILGMAKIALENLDNKDIIHDSLKKILGVGNELQILIDEVLDMTRLESGKIELIHEPFNIYDELDRINDMVVSQKKDITILPAHFNAVHYNVIGSPIHLRRVIENILGNAIKYNRPDGTIECWLDENNIDENHSIYRFTIQDTGIGMSEEFQRHMFEPFVQENANARTSYQGTGLGLAITKELIDLMKGTIAVKSTQNVGSTFVVEIPLEIDHTKPKKDVTDEYVKPDLNGLKILLVEDNDLNREIARYFITQSGAEIDEAVNGKEAYTKFINSAENTYDAIIMDVMMPEMNGLEATAAIRGSKHPQAKSIPIIAMTANAFSDDVHASRLAGMNAHVSKPINERKLLELIWYYTHIFK